MIARTVRLRDGTVIRVAAVTDPSGRVLIALDDGQSLTVDPGAPSRPAPGPSAGRPAVVKPALPLADRDSAAAGGMRRLTRRPQPRPPTPMQMLLARLADLEADPGVPPAPSAVPAVAADPILQLQLVTPPRDTVDAVVDPQPPADAGRMAPLVPEWPMIDPPSAHDLAIRSPPDPPFLPGDTYDGPFLLGPMRVH